MKRLKLAALISAAGGTGSGSIAVMSQVIKERYIDKPVYNLIVLPFEHEERTEERTIYNSATCLKSTNSVADAIFLADNQRYVRKNASLRNNLAEINHMMVEPFYNVLCAGEETKSKYIGARLLDAGDIIQSISGWSAIGYGHTQLPSIRLPFRSTRNFRDKSLEIHRGIEAMDAAVSELSFNCNPEEATRALYPDGAAAKAAVMPLTGLSPSPDFVKVAQSCRAHAERVGHGADLPAALARNIAYGNAETLLDIQVAAD